ASEGPPAIPAKRLPADAMAALLAMTVPEGAELLDRWLAGGRRCLRPAQRARVLERFSRSGLPLHLKLLFEQAQRWYSFTPIEESLAGASVHEAIRDLFAQLAEAHGPELVQRSLSLLAASRDGLSEDEILEILADDPRVIHEFRSRFPKSPDLGT